MTPPYDAAVPGTPPRDSLRSVWHGIRADIDQAVHLSADFSGDQISWRRRASFLFSPPLLCAAGYRVSHWLHAANWRRTARFVSWINFVVHRADLSPASEIGPGLHIPHTPGIVFRGHAGSNLTLLFRCAVVGEQLDSRRGAVAADCPRLGDDVTIGVFSVVRGGVTLGNRAFVGASCTVRSDLPAHTAFIAGRRVARGSA